MKVDLRVLCVILFAQVSAVTASPTFSVVYPGFGPETGVNAIPLSDGYLLVGSFSPEFGLHPDVRLLRTDLNGDILWSRTYGGAGRDIPADAILSVNGGLVICGSTFDGSVTDPWVLALDSQYDSLWCMELPGPGNDCFSSVVRVQSGGYAVTGTMDVSPTSGSGVVYRLTEAGSIVWSVEQQGTLWLRFADISESGDTLTCLGTVSDTEGNTDFILLRLNSLGQVISSISIDLGSLDEAGALIADDEGCFIAGSSLTGVPGQHDYVLLRTDPQGTVIWETTLGGDSWDRATGICSDGYGGCLLSGYSRSVVSGEVNRSDGYLVRVDSLGTVLWTRNYGTVRSDYPGNPELCPDNGYAIAGTVTEGSTGTLYDAWLLRVDQNGDVGGQGTEPGSGSGVDFSISENPSRGTIVLSFAMEESGPVTLYIYDLTGRLVASLLRDEILPAGNHQVAFDPNTATNGPLPSSVYVVVLIDGTGSYSRKLTVIRGER